MSNLPFGTESNFKDRHPFIKDAFHNCQQSLSISLLDQQNFNRKNHFWLTASIKVVSSVIMKNSKTNIIFLMHIQCIKIVKC